MAKIEVFTTDKIKYSAVIDRVELKKQFENPNLKYFFLESHDKICVFPLVNVCSIMVTDENEE